MSSEAFTFRPQDIVQNLPKQAKLFFIFFILLLCFISFCSGVEFSVWFWWIWLSVIIIFYSNSRKQVFEANFKTPRIGLQHKHSIAIMLGQSVFNTGKD